MNKEAELNEEKLARQEVSSIPSGESVLAELGIEPATLKLITPKWKRNQVAIELYQNGRWYLSTGCTS